jgi:hypothetical protein
LIKYIGADATNDDLAEHVAAHLEDVCCNLDDGGYLTKEELPDLQCLVRAAARKPDLLVKTRRCKTCAPCLQVEAAKAATYKSARAKESAVDKARHLNACVKRIPETVTDSMRQSHTWERIARDLCAYLRRQILDLDEGSPEEEKWIRDRARVAVKRRSEQMAKNVALRTSWELAAAHRENARNTWTEGAKGVIHNNDVQHLAARWELNYFAISDDVPYMHEI